MAKYILLILIISPLLVQGGLREWFGFGEKSSTTTPPPSTTTASPTTTRNPSTTTTPASQGACWWTQCGTRCAAGAAVHDFNAENCNTGKYKFRCCSG